MKRSDELKQQKGAKVKRMQEIWELQTAQKRALSTDEQTEWDGLDAEVKNLDTEIARAERMENLDEQHPRGNEGANHQQPKVQVMKRASKVYSCGRAIRGHIGEKMDGLEHEVQVEMKRRLEKAGMGVNKNAIYIPTTPILASGRQLIQHSGLLSKRANENTTTTHADVQDLFVEPEISIFGQKPMYEKIGAGIIDGVSGSYRVSKKTPTAGEAAAEEAALSNDANDPSGVILTPHRFGAKDVWTMEQLAQENPAIHAALVADLLVGADRALTKYVFQKIVAGATDGTAAGATAITEAGLDALMELVDGEMGAFLMNRSNFFTGKKVPFEAGTAERLLNKIKGMYGEGETWEGEPVYYSPLFEAANPAESYAVYGDMREVKIPRWGMIEIIIDPYTLAENGYTKAIAHRLADAAVRNSAAISKTSNLSA